MATKTTGKTLKIRQIHSSAGAKPGMAETLRGLGLRRTNHVVERADTPQIRGMIRKVHYLIKVEE